MRLYQQFLLVLLLAFSSLSATHADEAARDVFKIPVYPGTETFPFRSVGESLLAPPFGTLMRVYKTSDGSALDAAKVTAFFDESLRAKGWTTDDPQAQPTFLVMRTQVYENPPDGTRIQVAGDFKVWVAPHDGMLTIWMQQWRISQVDQKTRTQIAVIVEKLEDFAKNQPTKDNLGNSNSLSWEEDYTNEYLIERRQFLMTDGIRTRDSHFGPDETLYISILTYRDAEIAREEQKRRSPNWRWRFGNFAALTIGKSLVTIEARSQKQEEKVAALETFLSLIKAEN